MGHSLFTFVPAKLSLTPNAQPLGSLQGYVSKAAWRNISMIFFFKPHYLSGDLCAIWQGWERKKVRRGGNGHGNGGGGGEEP